ncbi:DUF5682 family protein [Taibaiella soli]|uniref:Uncharacterized protein n=1 Tax=Taibaiella soli TaxID=1649169 RepID=A0A2W2AP03_9BACT|nr:DUF5682 family protein [Taibaiella soli]PZF74100.1 hypothetical protein DN068_03545 [Taibaiella soli]
MEVLGIRHHGPGSARNVRKFLEEMKPDIVLVEGPPDADGILQWVGKEELRPPVAILVYQPDDPKHSVFYPFAEFSAEWQAILYARQNNIPVRFMDLPAMHMLAIEKQKREALNKTEEQSEDDVISSIQSVTSGKDEVFVPKKDPISYMAEAAGFDDGEHWWEMMFEQRRNNEGIFEAVGEAMQELRTVFPGKKDRKEQLREAYMRKVIRQAEREMFTNIAVICGAWHAPALKNMPKQKDDNELLKGLPKVKTECTWVPWTYNRLSFESGYGAGIHSPGWYEHLWNYPEDDGTRWMSKVAGLFRQKQMDTSVAHVIESVRLANALAALRQMPRAGLQELNEATWSVLCNGEDMLLQLIRNELIVGNRIGSIPDDIPKPPLQVDIERAQKRLRLAVTADFKEYTLDLRKENDLERSIFLHRLQILDIDWGQKNHVGGKGTFKELWRLQWRPELSVDIVEKGTWGNTVEEAASAWIIQECKDAQTLHQVAVLLQQVIPAELSDAAEFVGQHINDMAAATNDVLELVKVIPGLAGIVRYGNVRQTDAGMILSLLSSMIARICIGLPAACVGIDEDTAISLTDDCTQIEHSIQLLKHQMFIVQWQQCLQQIAYNQHAASMLRGFAVRQLMDYRILQGDELYNIFYSSLSKAVAPADAGAWLEGFLKGSGTILLLDDNLWQTVNNWVKQLDEGNFTQLLPLLRRTFAEFSQSERRRIGEKVKSGTVGTTVKVNKDIDVERARMAIPVVMQLLGYN